MRGRFRQIFWVEKSGPRTTPRSSRLRPQTCRSIRSSAGP